MLKPKWIKFLIIYLPTIYYKTILMEQQQTNLQRVKSALESGMKLTVVSAIKICKTSELRTYITKLIRQGMNIQSEWKENKGKRFKVYWLSND